MTRLVWLVKGEVTDRSAHLPKVPELGDPEWQFSDGPPSQRSMSSDYLSLEEGLAEHADCGLMHEDSDNPGQWLHGGSPLCQHQWSEWVGEEGELLEPAMDVCNSCGAVRR